MDMDIEAIRKQVEQQVMQYFHLEPTVTDAPYAGMVTGVDVISHLEHSLLNPDTTLETIERECAVARKYSVAAVCVAPYYVPAAREILLGSPGYGGNYCPHCSYLSLIFTDLLFKQERIFSGCIP